MSKGKGKQVAKRSKAPPNAKYQVEEFVEALRDTGGIIKNAASRMGCSRQTVYNAVKAYPEVADALHEEREKLKDLVEERLVEQIQQGNMTAIIWYSKTQMKDRGYIERVEHTGKDGGAVPHQVEIVVRRPGEPSALPPGDEEGG